MLNKKERIIHAVIYEVFALLSITLIMVPLFDIQLDKSITIGIAFSIFTVIWTMVFNHSFDWILKKRQGNTEKSVSTRIVHAITFELSMLIPTLPLLAWWLNTTLLGALKIELFLAVYITIYTFFFNLIYDHVKRVTDRVY